MTVQLTIAPQISPERRGEYLDAEILDLRDLDAVDAAGQGIAQVRRRVDRNEWDYGTAVVDDLRIPMHDLSRFGGLAYPSSIFRLSGRDGALVQLSYNDILVYTGFCSETGTIDDVNTDTTRIQSLAPETILRQVRPAAGDIRNGASLSNAIAGCFLQPAVSTLLGAPEINPPSDIQIAVADSSALNTLSAYAALNALLLAADMVAVFQPDMQVWVGQRGRRVNRPTVSLERGDILSINDENAGRARTFTAIETRTSDDDDTVLSVEVESASEQYGRRLLEIDLDWVDPSDKESILNALLTRLVRVAREWKVVVPFSVMLQNNAVILPMDPVDIRIDADVPAGSPVFGVAEFDTAEFPVVSSPGIIADTYVIAVRLNFSDQTIEMHLREDPN